VSGYIICRAIADRKQTGESEAENLQEQLEYELQQQRGRLRLLLDLNNRVASHLELRQVFQAISSELRRIFDCELAGLALPEVRQGVKAAHDRRPVR
jgi:formate hydrogenlyase transcriptional activator